LRAITDQQKLVVACPYCNAEAVVDLDPYRREIIPILKANEGTDVQSPGYEYRLSDTLPTQKPE
jgi:hypothetical protein